MTTAASTPFRDPQSLQPYALLYLSDLRLVRFGTRDECKNAIRDATIGGQAFVVLRYRERAGRALWAPQETHYLDKLFDY